MATRLIRGQDGSNCNNGCSSLGCRSLGFALLLATCLLEAVLRILLCTAAKTLLLDVDALPLLAVLRFELLQLLHILVDQTEACTAATSEHRPEAEQHDALGVVHLVHRGQLDAQLLLGHIRKTWVDDVNHELLPPKQGVCLELASSNVELHCSAQPGTSELREPKA